MASAEILPVNAPVPRLCHIIKWPDFDGYGFNLHAEKTKIGQYIGKVDKDSPAELAGLRQGDRIIEVNGINIANENHKQVVERIKELPNETKMLVLDDEADRYYKERKLVVKSLQGNVQYIKTPVPRPGTTISPVTNGPTGQDSDASSPASSSAAGSTAGSAEAETPAQIITREKEPKVEELPIHLAPRLCHLVKWPDFDGYGFNIHADKTKSGHIIGKVDSDSPAETAGMRQGDYIIEVNGINVSMQPHKQVVQHIKAMENETKLLLLSEEGEKYCKEKTLVVKSSDKNVIYIKTPVPRPSSTISTSEPSKAQPSPSKSSPQLSKAQVFFPPQPSPPQASKTPSSSQPSPSQNGPQMVASTFTSKQTSSPTKSSPPISPADNHLKTDTMTPSVKPASRPLSENADNGLNLNISAAEMRKILSQRKKVDPKKEQIDLKKKFQMIQNM